MTNHDPHELLKNGVARCMEILTEAQRSGVGIGAATQELAKAQKALRQFEMERRSETESGSFANVTEAARWVIAEGFLVKDRSAQEHLKRNVARQADGTLLRIHVEDYALRTWENPSRASKEEGEGGSHKDRLTKATADLAELKYKERLGSLLDAAEEEARDAAVLLGIRRHLELGVPERVKRMIGDLAAVMTEEQQAVAMSRLPEWIEMEMERIADAFHGVVG